MKMRRLMNIGFFLPTLTKGHSWIDAFFRDDKWPAANEDKLAKIVYGGSSAGGPDYASGFPRNYPTRGYPNINTGYSCKHLDGGTSNVCCNPEDYYGPGDTVLGTWLPRMAITLWSPRHLSVCICTSYYNFPRPKCS